MSHLLQATLRNGRSDIIQVSGAYLQKVLLIWRSLVQVDRSGNRVSILFGWFVWYGRVLPAATASCIKASLHAVHSMLQQPAVDRTVSWWDVGSGT